MTIQLPKANYVAGLIDKSFGALSTSGVLTVQQIAGLDAIQKELEPSPHAPNTVDITSLWRITALSLVRGFFCDANAENELSNFTGRKPDGNINLAQHPNDQLYKLTVQNFFGKRAEVFFFDADRDVVRKIVMNDSWIRFMEKEDARPPNLQLFAGFQETWVGSPILRPAYRPRHTLRRVRCYTSADIKVFEDGPR